MVDAATRISDAPGRAPQDDAEQSQSSHSTGGASTSSASCKKTAAVASAEQTGTEVSWTVVAMMYAVGCGLSFLAGSLEYAGFSSIQGVWLVFAPFGPCLLYALHRTRLQRKAKAHKD